MNSKLLKSYTPGVSNTVHKNLKKKAFEKKFEAFEKKFEAEGRTNQKIKVYTSADVLFSPLLKSKKKIYMITDVLFFTEIQREAKQKKIFGLIHDSNS